MANFDDFFSPRPLPVIGAAMATATGLRQNGAEFTGAPRVAGARVAAGQSVVTTKVGRLEVGIAMDGFHTP
mgnify:CR=1 FL=1